MPKHVDGHLTITRTSPGDGDGTIRVEVWGSNPTWRLVIAEVSLGDFAMCITGRTAVPAQLRVFDPVKKPVTPGGRP